MKINYHYIESNLQIFNKLGIIVNSICGNRDGVLAFDKNQKLIGFYFSSEFSNKIFNVSELTTAEFTSSVQDHFKIKNYSVYTFEGPGNTNYGGLRGRSRGDFIYVITIITNFPKAIYKDDIKLFIVTKSKQQKPNFD